MATQSTWWDDNPLPTEPLASVMDRGGVRLPTTEPVSSPYGATVTPGQPGIGGTYQPPATGFSWDIPNTAIQPQLQAILSKYPPTYEGIQQALPELRAAFGGTVNWNNRDILSIPGYGSYDVLKDRRYQASGGQDTSGLAWMFEPLPGYYLDEQGQPQRTDYGRAQGATSGSVPAPYAGTFTGGGPYPLSSIMGGGFLQPWTEAWKPPTAADMQQDPGWQFRMAEGAKAIERSAAAKGTLLSGGTLKDLTQYAQDYASNEADRMYNRRLAEYNNAFSIYNANVGNIWNRLDRLAGYGLNAAGGQAGAGQNYANAAGSIYGAQGDAEAAAAAARAGGYGRLAEYGGLTLADILARQPWQT